MSQDDPLTRAQPWLRQLASENGTQEPWGYAAYYLPTILGLDSIAEVRERHDRLLDAATEAIGCRIMVTPPFMLQALEWPQDLDSDADILANQTAELTLRATLRRDPSIHFMSALREQNVISRAPANNSKPTVRDESTFNNRDADAELTSMFERLRVQFRHLRDLPRSQRWPMIDHGTPGQYSGLIHGLLESVFLVIDEYSAFTWWDVKPADRAWVWAVDPDFEEQEVLSPGSGLCDEYRGYLRVRPQQLVHNFYEARRYHPNVTLRMLWEMAKQTKDFAFVSRDSIENQLRSTNIDVGSALWPNHLRPAWEQLPSGGRRGRLEG